MMDNLFSTEWLKDFESRIEAAFFPSAVAAEMLPPWRAAALPYVKKKSGCHLFVCCNYNPEQRVNHPAADYKIAVLNLYRFTKDTGPVVNEWSRICYSGKGSPLWTDFEKCRNTVDMVRSIIAHNNSPENGLFEAAQVESYQKWCMGIIGKKKPVSDEDYKALLHAVTLLNQRICNYLEDGLKQLKRLDEKALQACFRTWEGYIIGYYTSNGIKSTTLESYLVVEYCREKSMSNPQTKKEFRNAVKHAKLWMHEKYLHDDQIRKLNGWLTLKGAKKALIQKELKELQAERNYWEAEARTLIRKKSPTDDEVYQKMVSLCEEDFFKNGLGAFWDTQLSSGKPLISMLPGTLLPQYIKYKFNETGARTPI